MREEIPEPSADQVMFIDSRVDQPQVDAPDKEGNYIELEPMDNES